MIDVWHEDKPSLSPWGPRNLVETLDALGVSTRTSSTRSCPRHVQPRHRSWHQVDTQGKTPTPMIATWTHMHQWGIKAGALRRIVLHTIQNVATVMQTHAAMLAEGTDIDSARRRVQIPQSLADRLHATALAKYARTIATQSGHVVVGLEFGSGVPDAVNLSVLMDAYANFEYADSTAVNKVHHKLHREILIPGRRRGTKRIPLDAQVYITFDLVLLVEDWSSTQMTTLSPSSATPGSPTTSRVTSRTTHARSRRPCSSASSRKHPSRGRTSYTRTTA